MTYDSIYDDVGQQTIKKHVEDVRLMLDRKADKFEVKGQMQGKTSKKDYEMTLRQITLIHY